MFFGNPAADRFVLRNSMGTAHPGNSWFLAANVHQADVWGKVLIVCSIAKGKTRYDDSRCNGSIGGCRDGDADTEADTIA